MAEISTPNNLVPMMQVPTGLWNQNLSEKESDEDIDYGNDHRNHQGEEDEDGGGDDEHDPDEDGTPGSHKAVAIRHPHINVSLRVN
jgi:hypothetical protein